MPADLLKSHLAAARESLQKLDYDGSAAALQKAGTVSVDGLSQADAAAIARLAIEILLLTERVHDDSVATSVRAGEANFILAPSRVTTAGKAVVDGWSSQSSNAHFQFAKAVVHYLHRELEEAVAVLVGSPLPNDAYYWQLLATCYMLDDKPTEARSAIDRALALAPDDSENKRISARVGVQAKAAKRERVVSGRWPSTMASASDYRDVCRSHVLADFQRGMGWLKPNSKIVTIGSCFATNIADALKRQNYDAYSFMLGEEINNTFINLEVFKIIDGKTTSTEYEANVDHLLTPDFMDQVATFGKKLRDADLMIFTLGLSQGFFDKAGSPIFLKGTGGVDRTLFALAEHRVIEAEENVENIVGILEIARRINPKLRVVLTLSPVPMRRTFGRKSAVISDSLSKSQLRVSADRVVRTGAAIYWPSFEMAKWLSPHVLVDGEKTQFFGADDLDSRHVSRWIVDMIMGLFIEYLGPSRTP